MPKDNAAMEAEPPKADPSTRKRRFQFSLRTLLIGVTLFAVPMGYVGQQAKIVRERKAVLERQRKHFSVISVPANQTDHLSRLRRWLGDLAFGQFVLDASASDDDAEEIGRAFAEADVWRNGRHFPRAPQ
jgi:hypothetical protein